MIVLKKIFDFVLFSNLFIAACAVVMVYQTYFLFFQLPLNFQYNGFVFFSTICSYNFHWILTPKSVIPSYRVSWFLKHKGFQIALFFIGLCASFYFFILLSKNWHWLSFAALLTFLYSAPKIKLAPFHWLKKIAIGKTICLALVWTFVTTVLPFLIEGKSISTEPLLFFAGQFFFLHAICILFDYRDRRDDKAEGIRSMVTFFSEKGITILFNISITLAIMLFALLPIYGLAWRNIVLLIIPVVIVFLLCNYAKKNFSDYLYYFILDGLMMFSGILLWIMNQLKYF